TPGQCSSDALSQATLPCMRGGDYYIQVITPKESSGILNLTATSSLNPDVNCMPIDLLLPEVAFEVLDSCMGDTIKLKNKSSVGSNIEYKWNIDELSWESNEFEPNLYVQNQSAKKNITIRLIVKNLITNNSDTLEKKVVLWPKPKIKIERTVPNNGTEVVLNASIDFNCNSQDTTIKISTYKWIFGEGQSSDNDYLKGIKYIDTGKKDVSLIVGNKVCFSEVHDTFTVVMPPFARFDITDSCLGDTINFINKSTTGSNLTYKWMISSLDWESNEFEPRLLLPDQNTKMKFGIRLIVKDLITNASDTFDRQIIFLPALKLKIIETAPNNGKLSDVLCPGDTAILKVKTDVPISQTDIKWNTGDTGTDSIVVIAEKSMNYIVTVSESGNYCGTGIAGNNLTVTENYLNSKRIEKEICGSDSITPGVSQKPGYLYHWMPSEGINNTEIPNPGIWINKNKDYILKISNHEAGCFLEYDTINITYVAKPEFNLVNKLKMCPGSEITLEYKGKTDSTVTWTISTGKILSNDRILKVKENGKYIIAVKAKSCIFRDTTVVDYYPKPTAGMSLNTNTYAKQRNIIFKNTSSESDHYLWNFGDSTISKNESPTHQYQKGGKYKVILYAYNDKECVDSASTEILDILNDDVISSNVFTPNGDGYNDEFTVKIAGATKFKGQIFNRWGKKLFEWEDQNKGWDGKYLGEDCPTNTYFYIIEGDGPEINHTERKGWIEILR
ncbi:MAG: gliding motility-associated C-terminal domain-containing protein, partial [Bacteroidota bacterium]|nr:gliding motility-associated C-terminal domain-containing protein [Bacteroidota bacterium]